MLHNGSYAFQGQRTELVLFEKVVQILFEHFKHETRVTLVLKDFVGSNEIEFVGVLLSETRQNAYLDLTLSGIAWMIFKYFNGNYLVGSLVPTFNHLTESASSEKFEHFVAISHRVEYLMQYQLIVAFRVVATSIVVVIIVIIVIVAISITVSICGTIISIMTI